MTQKYTVPFYIDESLEDVIAEDESLTKEELLDNIRREGENHNVTVDIGLVNHIVTGDIESLASFFMMLDGPGPSFEMDSFTEWVLEEGIKVPEKPIDVLAEAQGGINQLECLCEDLIFKTLDSIYGGRAQWENDPQVFNDIEEMLVNIGETFSHMDANRPKTQSDFPIDVALRYG